VKYSSLALVATAAFALLGGCATITKGTTQVVTVNSNVSGADVYLDSVLIGKTPFSGSLKKNKSTLTVKMAGYAPKTVTLSKSLEGMFWGNIITGGTLGSITDFASGAAYSYAPSTYEVDLIAEGQSPTSFRDEVELRRFALSHYPELLREASTEDKTYTRALAQMLGSSESEAVLVGWVSEAAVASRGDRVGFSAKVVAHHGS